MYIIKTTPTYIIIKQRILFIWFTIDKFKYSSSEECNNIIETLQKLYKIKK